MEIVSFQLDLMYIPIFLERKNRKNEVIQSLYVLREMSGLERDDYLETQRKRIDIGNVSDPSSAKVKDVRGLQTLILRYSLKKVDAAVVNGVKTESLDLIVEGIKSETVKYEDLTVSEVSDSFINTLPASQLKPMCDQALELSGLNIQSAKKNQP